MSELLSNARSAAVNRAYQTMTTQSALILQRHVHGDVVNIAFTVMPDDTECDANAVASPSIGVFYSCISSIQHL